LKLRIQMETSPARELYVRTTLRFTILNLTNEEALYNFSQPSAARTLWRRAAIKDKSGLRFRQGPAFTKETAEPGGLKPARFRVFGPRIPRQRFGPWPAVATTGRLS